MVSNWLLYLATLLGLLLFHTYYTGWLSWFFLLFIACMPLFSFLCSLPAMRALRLTAQMDGSCLRDAQARLTFTAGRTGRMPTPLYRFSLTRTDEMSGEEVTVRLRLAAQESCSVMVPTVHCGSYRYRLGRGYVYDYLGLFALPMKLPQLGACQVLPEAKPPQQTPNFSRFQFRSFRPKYGGGFSEIHEHRAYQPGDAMRDVHWKLSAKTDALIVREPLEPNRGQVIVSLDLSGSREALDSTFDTLLWLSGWLLDREVTHEVCWIDPATLEPRSRTIAARQELDDLVSSFLRTKVGENTPSIAARPFPRADWRYHIHPQLRAQQQEETV